RADDQGRNRQLPDRGGERRGHLSRVRRHVHPRRLLARGRRARAHGGGVPLPLRGVRRRQRRGAGGAGDRAAQGLSRAGPGERPASGVLMASASTIAIVGASLTGQSAAATLREEGFDGRVVLIGAEPQPPYDRPPLSKNYLRGGMPFEKALLRPLEFYRERNIEMRLGTTVTRVEPEKRILVLPGGERLEFDQLLIATGGRNRRFPIPGLDLPGVHDLRTVADADRIREAIAAGGRAVVVGMGFIGAEVAASMRQSGLEVVAVEPFKTPLYRALGEEIGRVVEGLHRDHGVELILEDAVTAFEGAGKVERIVTRNGRRIECNLAVFGLGIEPATELVAGTTVRVDNGIVVDDQC